jgi:hypothetical protein
MSQSKEWKALNRLAASRMFLERHEALSASKASITLRYKLKRLGIRDDSPAAIELLALIDAIGYQSMLANQPVASRFAAVKRDIHQQKVWK